MEYYWYISLTITWGPNYVFVKCCLISVEILLETGHEIVVHFLKCHCGCWCPGSQWHQGICCPTVVWFVVLLLGHWCHHCLVNPIWHIRQNDRLSADNIFIFFPENSYTCILIQISLEFFSNWSICQKLNIGSGNCLAPIRCQWWLNQWWLCSLMHVDGLVQDCSISIANAQEILRSCTKPSLYIYIYASPGLWWLLLENWYFWCLPPEYVSGNGWRKDTNLIV